MCCASKSLSHVIFHGIEGAATKALQFVADVREDTAEEMAGGVTEGARESGIQVEVGCVVHVGQDEREVLHIQLQWRRPAMAFPARHSKEVETNNVAGQVEHEEGWTQYVSTHQLGPTIIHFKL